MWKMRIRVEPVTVPKVKSEKELANLTDWTSKKLSTMDLLWSREGLLCKGK